MTSRIDGNGSRATVAEIESPRLRLLLDALGVPGVDRGELIHGFWQEMERAGTPLVEPIPEEDGVALVTFLWRETDPTGVVRLYEPVSWRPAEERELAKIDGTDIWYLDRKSTRLNSSHV